MMNKFIREEFFKKKILKNTTDKLAVAGHIFKCPGYIQHTTTFCSAGQDRAESCHQHEQASLKQWCCSPGQGSFKYPHHRLIIVVLELSHLLATIM